jgi:hypothetical protein
MLALPLKYYYKSFVISQFTHKVFLKILAQASRVLQAL